MAATAAAPALRLSAAKARAAVLAVQGLAGEPYPDVTTVLVEAGFLRTLGGAEVCLALADRLSSKRDARDQERAGMRPGEAQEVGKAVLVTLAARGPLSTND